MLEDVFLYFRFLFQLALQKTVGILKSKAISKIRIFEKDPCEQGKQKQYEKDQLSQYQI